MTSDLSLSSRRRRLEWWVLGTLMLVLAAVLCGALLRERLADAAAEEDRLQAQSKVVEENLERQLDGVSAALAGLREAVGPLQSAEQRAQASEKLALVSAAMPGVRTMAILDVNGTIVASSRDALLGKNFSHREYFDAPRRFPDPAVLYVSPPIQAALDGFVVFLGKALLGPDGKFAGVIAATLNPEYFDVLLRSVLYAPDMRSALAHGDGRVFINVPSNDQSAGVDLAKPGLLLHRHHQSNRSTTVISGPDFATGEDRLIAVHTVNGASVRTDKPLAVILSRDPAVVFKPWREKAWRFAAFFLVVLTAACSAVHASQRRRLAMSRLAAEAALERQLGAERLALALDGSGLALFDWNIRDDRLFHSAQAAVMRGDDAVEAVTTTRQAREHVHPDDVQEVLKRIKDALTGVTDLYSAEFRVSKKFGGWVWVRARGRVVERDASGRALRLSGTYADINERKLAEQRLRRLAEIDPLTDLPNRALFHDRLQRALARTARTGPMALLFLDIDRFKQINDTLGHHAGDQLLKVFAQRMQSTVRQTDTVARLAGDEFTIILEGLSGVTDAKSVAAKLVAVLREPVALDGKCYQITASIGIAMPLAGDTEEALLRRADEALYEAKRQGRNGYYYEEPSAVAAPLNAEHGGPGVLIH